MFLVIVFFIGLLPAEYRTPAGTRRANAKAKDTVLPGGRLITPVGQHHTTGPGTFGLAVAPDGLTLVSADGGPHRYSLTFLRKTGTAWSSTKLSARRPNEKPEDEEGEDDWRSVFMGLAFANEHELYASEGNSGRVRLVDTRTGRRVRT
jgi:hypothetical protein